MTEPQAQPAPALTLELSNNARLHLNAWLLETVTT